MKNTALWAGGMFWAEFWGTHRDTVAKLAVFTFALDHLRVAAYELLRRVASRAGDDATAKLAADIAAQEREAAAELRRVFPRVARAVLSSP